MFAIVTVIVLQLLYGTVSAIPVTQEPGTALFDCLDVHSVPYLGPSDPTWAELICPYNLRLAYTPVALVVPVTIPEIQDAVTCAGSLDVKVQARSGGHSYASNSLGGANGSMIVDLENFQNILLDNGTRAKPPTFIEKSLLTVK